MRHFSKLVVASAVLAAAPAAQRGIGALYETNISGGNFDMTQVLFDSVEQQGVVWNTCQSVVRLPDGTYLGAFAREDPNGDHKYFQFEIIGGTPEVVASFSQPNPLAVEGAGMFELAWDHRTDAASRVYGGTGGGAMWAFDWQTGAFVSDITSFAGQTGLDGQVGNDVDALAVANIGGTEVFVSRNNTVPNTTAGGNGSQTNWHVINRDESAFSSITQVHSKFREPTPDPIPDLPGGGINDGGIFGAGFDTGSETLWFGGNLERRNPNPSDGNFTFYEVDLDGNATGKVVSAVGESVLGPDTGAWGFDIYDDGLGNGVMVYQHSDNDTGVGGVNGIDFIVEMYIRFEYADGCGPSNGQLTYVNEPFIGNGVVAGTPGFEVRLEGATLPLGTAVLWRANPGFLPPLPGLTNCEAAIVTSAFQNAGAGTPDATGLSWNFNIPDDIGIVGVETAFQALIPSATVLPLDFSPAGAIRVTTNVPN